MSQPTATPEQIPEPPKSAPEQIPPQPRPTLEQLLEDFHGRDHESVDASTFLAAIQILTGNRQPPTTVGGAVLMRLRELQAPIRFVRHNDARFCIEALRQLPDVTRGLSPDQNDDLLALVSELHAKGCEGAASDERKARGWRGANGGRRIKKIHSKLCKVHTAMTQLQRYLGRVDMPLHPSLEAVLQNAQEASHPARLPPAELVSRMMQSPPTQETKVALYDFFVNQCGLQKNDAEVRVGKIVKQLFGSKVVVIEQPRSRTDERKGSEAVRKAVSRRRTSDKSRRNSRKS